MAATLFGSGCQDEIDFGFGEWEAEVDTVTIYTLDRPEYQGLPSAYDIVAGVTRRVEDAGETGRWDFALTGGSATEPLSLTPIGALLSVEAQAGIAPVDAAFLELGLAPRDTSEYVRSESIPVEEAQAYVIRSRQASSGVCGGIFYGKIEALAVDQDAGSLTFQVTANPNCNDRRLIPPED